MNRLAHIFAPIILVAVLFGYLPNIAYGRGLSGKGTSSAPLRSCQKPENQTFYHTVERGETLSAIARKYNVTVEDILAVNPSLSKDKISPGMIIRVPEKGIKLPTQKNDERVAKDNSYRVEATQSQSNRVGKVKDSGTPQDNGSRPLTKGVRPYVVPAGQTIYNLCKITGWSEEQLLYYNPQVKHGLRAGMTILVPQETEIDSLSIVTPDMDKVRGVIKPIPSPVVPTMPHLKIVLALPFSTDNGNRFSDYYEGFLLALKKTQESGNSVDLYVYDCSSDNLRQTINEIGKIPSVDYIIGGVSDESIRHLASAAELKGASYVIPFTSKSYSLPDAKDINIFQINTPHDVMNEIAAARFVREFQGDHVCIVRGEDDAGQKSAFITTLKSHMNRMGMSYEELNIESSMVTKEDVHRLSQSHPRTVMIPTSSSLVSATGVLAPISHAIDSLGIDNVTAFGYPEWQTYYAMTSQMAKVNATFYTPFYANTKTPGYRAFQREFVSWFSHGIGNTYPKYSVLGYDTGRYFLFKDPEELYGEPQKAGLQSQFDFMADKTSPRRYYNHGVIFVQHKSDGTVEGR